MNTRCLSIALACASSALAPLCTTAQSANANEDGNAPRHTAQIQAIGALPVPGTSSSNPFKSFDIIYLDSKSQLMSLSSRSSKAVTIFNGRTDKPLGETPTVFAGVGSDNPHSGPNGTVIAGTQLWAGDYPSVVRVFDLSKSVTAPPQIAQIDTGGTLRADEMDYDPTDKLVGVTNGDPNGNAYPPFLSIISTQSFNITHKLVFDGSNGTPDARVGGLGSVLYDSATGKFLVSIVQVGSDATKGAIAVVSPATGMVENVFYGIDSCEAAGMAQGPGDNVLIGCDPGFPAPSGFTPRTYVINGRNGRIVADITQVGGEDEVWYNPGDQRYYTGSRDFFTSSSATAATPVLGVIDARTNRWIENVPTGPNSHAVAANPWNNHIYVPLESPNTVCGSYAGCVGVYAEEHGHGRH